MAGVGTTLVEPMMLGMDAVGVELEKKFVDQAKRNIQNVKSNDRRLGHARCMEGDARNLSGIVKKQSSSIILSPPYATSKPFNDLNFPLRNRGKQAALNSRILRQGVRAVHRLLRPEQDYNDS
jgi:tRNA G10  N-methylase Trm11